MLSLDSLRQIGWLVPGDGRRELEPRREEVVQRGVRVDLVVPADGTLDPVIEVGIAIERRDVEPEQPNQSHDVRHQALEVAQMRGERQWPVRLVRTVSAPVFTSK